MTIFKVLNGCQKDTHRGIIRLAVFKAYMFASSGNVIVTWVYNCDMLCNFGEVSLPKQGKLHMNVAGSSERYKTLLTGLKLLFLMIRLMNVF